MVAEGYLMAVWLEGLSAHLKPAQTITVLAMHALGRRAAVFPHRDSPSYPSMSAQPILVLGQVSLSQEQSKKLQHFPSLWRVCIFIFYFSKFVHKWVQFPRTSCHEGEPHHEKLGMQEGPQPCCSQTRPETFSAFWTLSGNSLKRNDCLACLACLHL